MGCVTISLCDKNRDRSHMLRPRIPCGQVVWTLVSEKLLVVTCCFASHCLTSLCVCLSSLCLVKLMGRCLTPKSGVALTACSFAATHSHWFVFRIRDRSQQSSPCFIDIPKEEDDNRSGYLRVNGQYRESIRSAPDKRSVLAVHAVCIQHRAASIQCFCKNALLCTHTVLLVQLGNRPIISPAFSLIHS